MLLGVRDYLNVITKVFVERVGEARGFTKPSMSRCSYTPGHMRPRLTGSCSPSVEGVYDVYMEDAWSKRASCLSDPVQLKAATVAALRSTFPTMDFTGNRRLELQRESERSTTAWRWMQRSGRPCKRSLPLMTRLPVRCSKIVCS